MKMLRISLLLTAVLVATSVRTTPAFAYGRLYNLVDDTSTPKHGAVQLANFATGNATNVSGDVVCVVYLGNYLYSAAPKIVVDLPDQVFDEIIGFECAKRSFQSAKDGKWYPVPRCIIYFGDVLTAVNNKADFERSLIRGTYSDPEVTRFDYALKQTPPGSANPGTFFSSEYERVSQPQIPVAPSHREPNLIAQPREIEPGVSIGLENIADITYFGENRPTLLIYFQSQVSIDNDVAMGALSEKIVRAMSADRVARHELNGVRLTAFNEPKRSRFHFRPCYTIDADGDGRMLPPD